jgi:hypothetical protein
MNTLTVDSISAFDHAFRPGLSIERLRSQAPAAFAENPFGRVSPSYRFISTRELVAALFDAGFAATEARQARARGERAGYARHLLRFRPLRTEVAVTEAIPELWAATHNTDYLSQRVMRASVSLRALSAHGIQLYW